jgi:uncharacterized membrane protein
MEFVMKKNIMRTDEARKKTNKKVPITKEEIKAVKQGVLGTLCGIVMIWGLVTDNNLGVAILIVIVVFIVVSIFFGMITPFILIFRGEDSNLFKEKDTNPFDDDGEE